MKPDVLMLDLPVTYISSDEAGRSLPKIPQNALKKDSNKVGQLSNPEKFDCLQNSYHVIEPNADSKPIKRKQSVNKNISHEARKCFITCDPSYSQLLESLPKVAKSDAGVLITGETGTGKELIANEIHHLSPRANRPFMTIDCGTRAADMLEAELFGHVKGAYTSATTTQAGLIAMSEGGTLFLDELNSMGLELQKKLMRFLQTHTYFPLGATKLCFANVRIIAAANIDMRQAVIEGKFKEDLYHRLKIYGVHIPPLRFRPNDIPLLAAHFADEFRAIYQKPNVKLSPKVIEYLLDDPLTGNVRELQNMLERGFVICDDESLELSDILDSPPPELNFTYDEFVKDGLSKLRRCYLHKVLSYNKGSVSAAAEQAGQDRSNFYKTLRNNGLNPDDYRSDKHKH